MKALVCEMCGGSNLLKQEGVFVCQNCKIKYTVEEAKKLMIEGIADVHESTVKVNNSTKLESLYKIARRAWDDGNSEQAQRKYEDLLVEDPDNWEPNFYSTYFQGINILKNDNPGGSVRIRGGRVNLSYAYRSGISPCISRIHGCLDSVFSLIEDIKDYDEQQVAVKAVENDVKMVTQQLSNIIDNEHARMKQEIAHYCDETNQEGSIVNKGLQKSNMNNKNNENRDSYKSDVSAIISLLESRKKRLVEVVGKRRFDEYWDAHQDEKKVFESEKQSLKQQITKLNKSIEAIPGYTTMIESQKRLQQEKDNALSSVLQPKTGRLNFFKWICIFLTIVGAIFFMSIYNEDFIFILALPLITLSLALSIVFGVLQSEKKKSYKIQQKNITLEFEKKFQLSNDEYSHVLSDVEKINKNISPLKDRIRTIDNELTKPR